MQPDARKQSLLTAINAIENPAFLAEIEAFTLSLIQPQNGLSDRQETELKRRLENLPSTQRYAWKDVKTEFN